MVVEEEHTSRVYWRAILTQSWVHQGPVSLYDYKTGPLLVSYHAMTSLYKVHICNANNNNNNGGGNVSIFIHIQIEYKFWVLVFLLDYFHFMQLYTCRILMAQFNNFLCHIHDCIYFSLLFSPEFGVFPAGGVRVGQGQSVHLIGVTSFELDAGGSTLHLQVNTDDISLNWSATWCLDICVAELWLLWRTLGGAARLLLKLHTRWRHHVT